MYFDVEAYADALDDLTQNSKPQINTLTMIAEENIKSAKLVVECIDKRLKKVKNIFLKKKAPILQKLTVLYLVDSICKNVGGIYLKEFGNIIVNAFCSSFALQTDENMKISFLKLLKTWPMVKIKIPLKSRFFQTK
jgi:pre-mRNA cleavage complex 2 protein Pcf11